MIQVGGKKTILFVDDEPDLRTLAKFMLQHEGYDVLTAGSGHEAFEIVKAGNVDAVVTDVRMPEGDGIELLERIKAVYPHRPPVIFVTAFADISIEDAYEKGVEAILPKPVDGKTLLAVLEMALTPMDSYWTRKHHRFEVRETILLNFPDPSTIRGASVVNIGRGGMFLAMSESFPSVGDKLRFRMLFEFSEYPPVEGVGIVRWVRTEAENGLSAGVGIEFVGLEGGAVQWLLSFLNDARVLAFIPKK